MSKLKVFFRKLLRLHVPECKYECEKIIEESRDYCNAEGKKGFFGCTRKVGHKGKHVACGTVEHEFFVWED